MEKQVYTVKQLNSQIRNLLESSYRTIWVDGEISGLSTPASGHIYFSLKEDRSVLRCAFFKNRQSRNETIPTDGMQILVKGQISYYEPRGDLQLIVSEIQESGIGALQKAFEALKKKLLEEGLFNEARKRPLPEFPQSIGIVTSDSGAALQDILTTLDRRYPMAKIQVFPCLVQGDSAAKSIIEAIDLAEKMGDSQLLIIARGGGSLEDLQAFNDENVCRRIARSAIPTVSAIGHETDFTICDFVCDCRAATPTAAAELVSPDKNRMRLDIANETAKLLKIWNNFIRTQQQNIDYLGARLIHPKALLAQRQLQLSRALKYLILTVQHIKENKKNLLDMNNALISAHSPITKLQYMKTSLRSRNLSLTTCVRSALNKKNVTMTQLIRAIELLGPDHTLKRGYAIVQDSNNKVILDSSVVHSGHDVKITVARGNFEAVVK